MYQHDGVVMALTRGQQQWVWAPQSETMNQIFPPLSYLSQWWKADQLNDKRENIKYQNQVVPNFVTIVFLMLAI
jgi:hypothetical protein